MARTTERDRQRGAGKSALLSGGNAAAAGKQGRSLPVDLLKGLAILAVLFQHTMSAATFYHVGAPIYVLQAVGLFMILAGYNGARSAARRGITTQTQAYAWPALLLPVAFVIDLAFELVAFQAQLPTVLYEPNYLRYLFVVALGIWLAKARPRFNRLFWLAALGLVFVYLVEYG